MKYSMVTSEDLSWESVHQNQNVDCVLPGNGSKEQGDSACLTCEGNEVGELDETDVDYAAEGRALLERVNLNLPGAPEAYDNVNPIYRHASGATLYIGNVAFASSKPDLDAYRINRIVSCQESGENGVECDMPFASNPAFEYLHFPIGRWRHGARRRGKQGWKGGVFTGDVLASPANCAAYFHVLFSFVERALCSQQHVLIHCYAGAHRAGTAGIACLMYFCDLDAATATLTAQAARPAIDPMLDFPLLLRSLERTLCRNR